MALSLAGRPRRGGGGRPRGARGSAWPIRTIWEWCLSEELWLSGSAGPPALPRLSRRVGAGVGPSGGRGGGGQLNAGPRESREWSHGEGGPGDGSGPREKVNQVWGGREEERGQNNIMHGVPCHQTWASS